MHVYGCGVSSVGIYDDDGSTTHSAHAGVKRGMVLVWVWVRVRVRVRVWVCVVVG